MPTNFFEKGNPGGLGGLRPNSGRRTKAVEQAEGQILSMEISVDGKAPEHVGLALWKELMGIAFMRDETPNAPEGSMAKLGDKEFRAVSARLTAIKIGLSRIFGRPRAAIDITAIFQVDSRVKAAIDRALIEAAAKSITQLGEDAPIDLHTNGDGH